MARLPSITWLIQQVDGIVVVFNEHTEEEIVRFDPVDSDATAKAQRIIWESHLSDEDKCFAHFWSGYFYGALRRD